MKKLLIIVFAINFISCSNDDDCISCDNYLNTVAENYGAHIKTINETTLHYRFIGNFRNAPEENETGEFGELNGYHFRIFKQGEITVNGEKTLSFPVTEIEKNELYDESNNAYSAITLEVRIISGSRDNLETFWFAKSGNNYLVEKSNRNLNSLNILEENKCRWITDGESGYYAGSILIKGMKNINEWISSY